MQSNDLPGDSSLQSILPKLLSLAGLIKNLALRFKGVARFLTLGGFLADVWLCYYLKGAFGWSLATSIGLALVLLIPVLLVGWCWFVMEQACDLPQRLSDCLNRGTSYASDALNRLAGEPVVNQSRVADIGKWGGLVYELRSLSQDTRELFMVFGGSLAFTNPLFIMALVISVLLIFGLLASAFLTGIFALFT